MTTISVIISSRLSRPEGSDRYFVELAVDSIRAQPIFDRMNIDVIIDIDVGTQAPVLPLAHAVRFVQSSAQSQAAALSTAARFIEGDYVAVLEDDDQWHPLFLEASLAALEEAGFVSSTQWRLMIVKYCGSIIFQRRRVG